MQRWGPRAWISKLFGYEVPGDNGDKYFPQGYTVAEVGPQSLIGSGNEEMNKTRARSSGVDIGGCPFSSRKWTDSGASMFLLSVLICIILEISQLDGEWLD